MEGVSSFLRQAAAEESSLTRSFWYGRFLQALPSGSLEACYQELQAGAEGATQIAVADGGAPPCKHLYSQVMCGETLLQHVRDATECLSTHETSLSPGVFDLITTSVLRPPDDVGTPSVSDILTQGYSLNWPILAEYFKDVVAERKDYSAGARKCGELARKVYQQVSQVEPARLRDVLEQNFIWTPAPETLSECIGLLETDNPLRIHVSLLIGSAVLERALGDVYLTVSKAAQCPSLLRDLLATEELEMTFGPTAMYLLRCLIGPPSGLNLRNVLWHGFAAHHEVPEEYAYLLLVMASSLGKQLTDHDLEGGLGKGVVLVVHRPFISFPQEELLAKVFEDLGDSELAAAEQLFSHSYFILPSMLPTWRAAIHALREKKYSHFLVLILPALEHALRRVFACANSCPERVLTAESTTLYTTLDEILSPVLPNGRSNHLKEEIGVAKMEMLLDLLVHPNGPRLRDRISHGEVDFHSLSRTLPVHLLCMCVIFCAQYTFKEDLKQVPLVAKCLAADGYVSLFHPISLLRRELQQLVSYLDEWRDIPRPSHCEEEDPHSFDPSLFVSAVRQSLEHLPPHCRPACLSTAEHISQLFQSGHPTPSAPLLALVARVWEQPLPTLHTARGDLELTEVLRRTVKSASAAVMQIKETATLRYHQWEQKQLRSRQRGNYNRLLASLQTYRAAVNLLVVLLTVTISYIPLDPSTCKKVIRKVLQFSENLSSQAHPSRNRWEEAHTLCHSLAGLAAQLLPHTDLIGRHDPSCTV